MSGGDAIPHRLARTVAMELVDELRHACAVDQHGEGSNPLFGSPKIMIAGSLRRQLTEVHDIELVVEPELPRTLLGEVDASGPTDVDAVLDRLVRTGRLQRRRVGDGRGWWGNRFKAAVAVGTVEGQPIRLPVDVFIVRPPASFAVILALRTGPARFSEWLVTRCQHRGRRVSSGRMIDLVGQPVETPTERDFLNECGVRWVEPEDRR